MISFLLLLSIVAIFQICGSLISWFFVKKFCHHMRTIMFIEMILMLSVSAILIIKGFHITSAVIFSVIIGIVSMAILNRIVPHKHQTRTERIGFLVFIAMCLHEFPEGLAFGSAYLIDPNLGIMTALIIALHNIPEGSIVSIPCFMRNKFKAGFKAVFITQLLYIAGGLIAYYFLVNVPQYFQALVMTFAAGAMLYIIAEEFFWMRKYKQCKK